MTTLTNDRSMVTTRVLLKQKINGSLNKDNMREWHLSEKYVDSEKQQSRVSSTATSAESYFNAEFKLTAEQRKARSNEYYKYGF